MRIGSTLAMAALASPSRRSLRPPVRKRTEEPASTML